MRHFDVFPCKHNKFLPSLNSTSSSGIDSAGTYAPRIRRLFGTRRSSLFGSRNFSEYSAQSRVVNKRESRKFRVQPRRAVRDRNVNYTSDFGWCLRAQVGGKRRSGVVAQSAEFYRSSFSFSLLPTLFLPAPLSPAQKDTHEIERDHLGGEDAKLTGNYSAVELI